MTWTRLAYGSASVYLNFDDEEETGAKVTDLMSFTKGQGHASGVLRKATQYADERVLYLWLEAQRNGDPHTGLSNEQLVQLYEKHGFVKSEGNRQPVVMERYPLLKGDEE